MQKSKITTILIILIILVYVLLSQFYLNSLGNIYTFIINPSFFIVLALILKIFMISPYTTNKYKKDIIQYVLIAILLYSLLYLLSGLLVEFGTNPYSSSIQGLTQNLFAIGLVIYLREFIRYKLIKNVYNEDKKIIFVLIVIVFSLLDFKIESLFNSTNMYLFTKQILSQLTPCVIKNILFTYIVLYTDNIPSFTYDIIYYLTLWLAPILPKIPWALEAILDMTVPLLLLLYCRYYINKKDRFHLNTVYDGVNPTTIVPFGICLVLIVWFTLGIFPIKPVGIATASMQPQLNVGDLAIIKKCTSNDINVQDVIEYQMEGYTVIHRVVNIYQTNGETYFVTKGDSNENEDQLHVSEEQLIGKVIFKIPYISLPTIWLNNFHSKTQVEVEIK